MGRALLKQTALLLPAVHASFTTQMLGRVSDMNITENQEIPGKAFHALSVSLAEVKNNESKDHLSDVCLVDKMRKHHTALRA